MSSKASATLTEDQVDPLAPPAITALVPAHAALGAPPFTLRVLGTGFKTGDRIQWQGAFYTTAYVSATELTTEIDLAIHEVAEAVSVAVITAQLTSSNVLTFDVTAEPTIPELPDLPDGFVLLADAYNRPLLVRADEVAGIEDATPAADRSGALYGLRSEGAHVATAYRRVTFRSGFQFYVAARSLSPLLTGLGVSSSPRKGK